MNERIAWLLKNVKGKLILDVGCGDGRISSLLNAIGVEVSRTRCEEAKNKCMVVCASIYNLPFKDCIFDSVIMTEVIEHLEKPYSALREAHRVLKTGSFFC